MNKEYDLNEFFEDDPYEEEDDDYLALDDSNFKILTANEIIEKFGGGET